MPEPCKPDIGDDDWPGFTAMLEEGIEETTTDEGQIGKDHSPQECEGWTEPWSQDRDWQWNNQCWDESWSNDCGQKEWSQKWTCHEATDQEWHEPNWTDNWPWNGEGLHSQQNQYEWNYVENEYHESTEHGLEEQWWGNDCKETWKSPQDEETEFDYEGWSNELTTQWEKEESWHACKHKEPMGQPKKRKFNEMGAGLSNPRQIPGVASSKTGWMQRAVTLMAAAYINDYQRLDFLVRW